MATIFQGPLGGFSGKLGPIIGTSWKGKAVIRAKALSVHNPNTELQQQERIKFGRISMFLSKVYAFILIGFHNLAKDMTELDMGVHLNLPDAITGTFPNYTVDFTKVILSKGNIDLPYDLVANVDGNDIVINWTDNSGLGNAKADDDAMVLLYNEVKAQSITNTAAAKRSDIAATVSVPTSWNTDTLHVYIAFYRNLSGDKDTSVSFYLGSFTI